MQNPAIIPRPVFAGPHPDGTPRCALQPAPTSVHQSNCICNQMREVLPPWPCLHACTSAFPYFFGLLGPSQAMPIPACFCFCFCFGFCFGFYCCTDCSPAQPSLTPCFTLAPFPSPPPPPRPPPCNTLSFALSCLLAPFLRSMRADVPVAWALLC